MVYMIVVKIGKDFLTYIKKVHNVYIYNEFFKEACMIGTWSNLEKSIDLDFMQKNLYEMSRSIFFIKFKNYSFDIDGFDISDKIDKFYLIALRKCIEKCLTYLNKEIGVIITLDKMVKKRVENMKGGEYRQSVYEKIDEFIKKSSEVHNIDIFDEGGDDEDLLVDVMKKLIDVLTGGSWIENGKLKYIVTLNIYNFNDDRRLFNKDNNENINENKVDEVNENKVDEDDYNNEDYNDEDDYNDENYNEEDDYNNEDYDEEDDDYDGDDEKYINKIVKEINGEDELDD